MACNPGGISIFHPPQSSVPAPSTSKDRPPLNSCITKLEPLYLSQHWKVENFASTVKLSRPGVCLRSHVFRHTGFPDACWQLCLYPGGKREENANNVSLFLKMSATTPSKEVLLKAEYRFYFMDDSDMARFSNVNIGDFHAKPPKGGHSWGLRNIPRQKVLNSLRDDGSLVVLCEIELIPDVGKATMINLCQIRCQLDRPSAVSSSDMTTVARSFVDSQMGLLTRSDSLSDCILEIRSPSHSSSSQSINHLAVHKCILSAHSDVFRAMFGHKTVLESVESRVIIEEFSPAAVRAMLEHMYTGKLSTKELQNHSEELLGLAEKYGLLHLKSVVQDHLSFLVNRHNICPLLAIADLYGANTLKQNCVTFLQARKREVLIGDDWTELKRRNPRLVGDVLEVLLTMGADQCSSPVSKRCRISD